MRSFEGNRVFNFRGKKSLEGAVILDLYGAKEHICSDKCFEVNNTRPIWTRKTAIRTGSIESGKNKGGYKYYNYVSTVCPNTIEFERCLIMVDQYKKMKAGLDSRKLTAAGNEAYMLIDSIVKHHEHEIWRPTL